MKFTCKQSDINESIQKLASIVNPRIPNPALLNIWINASKQNGLLLRATDSSRSIHYSLPNVEVEAEGTISVPAKKLAESIRVLNKDDEITFKEAKNGLNISASGTKFTIIGQDPKDFVPLKKASGEEIKVSGKELAKMISLTQFAAAKEAGRYSLNGIYFDCVDNHLALVGSDGKRLAQVVSQNITLPNGKLPGTIILANRSFDLLMWACNKADEVTLILSPQTVAIEAGEVYVDSLLVNGLYPDYKAILPKPYEYQITMDRHELNDALKRVSQFVDVDKYEVLFSLSDNGTALLSTARPGEGDAESQIEVRDSTENMKLAFNPDHILEVLKVLELDDVIMSIKDVDSPVYIKEQQEGLSYYYLVVPSSPTDNV